MKNPSIVLVTLIILLTNLQIQAQEVRNKGSLQVYKNEFYEEIKKASKEFSEKEKEPKKVLKLILLNLIFPNPKKSLHTSGTMILYRKEIPEHAGRSQQHLSLNQKFIESIKRKLSFPKITLSIGNMLKRQDDLLEREGTPTLPKDRKRMLLQECGKNMELFLLKCTQPRCRDKNFMITANCLMK